MLAVEKDNFHAARKLLELPGIDCNVTNGSGRTAMTLAAREGSLPLVELLHRRKAAVNKADKNGDTPLVWAIRELHFDIVKYLLDNAGATTDQKNTGGQTPLHIAAETGELEMFHTVLMAVHGRSSESDLCLNNEGRTCYSLFIEARKRNSRAGFGSPYYEQYKFSEILSKLSDIDVFDGGRSLLSWAAEYNDIVWLRALLGRGADRNQRDKMPPKGSRPSIRRTPVIWALEKDNLEAATLLATHDISVLSLVQEAKKRQESVPEACRLLQKLLPCLKDESLNRIDDEGKTALHYAAELPGSEITKLLTDHGISIDGLDNDSKTALQLAVENKKLENVTALLRRGAAFPEIPLNIWQELDPTGARRCVRFTRTGLDGLELAFLAGSEARDWNTRPTSSSLLLCDPQSLSVQMENAPIHPTVPGRTLNDIITSTTYVRYQRASGPDTTVNRLSVFFPPAKQSYRKKAQLLRPETLAMEWAVTSSETENKAFYTYISALPQELPATPASFCKQLILNLRQKWEIRAQYVRDHIAELRQSQIRRKGRNQTIINHLAQHSELRGTLREYLSGHVQGLQTMITAQKKFPGSEKQELFEAVHCLDQTIKSQLDDSERAAQEVLQLELAWVSISEAASVKRLSWMTIIFLPLMFSSSLFGMNIDLLKDNPDWTWYLVFSAVSVLITICLWTLLKYIPIETWRKSDLIARNKFSDHNVSLETGKSG
ncbi:ankyrin [Aspergillus uvarum CBS 121591]|uniref:Ankyrin n=1 Tax=Aspergillus uvarum CBS 121591 TaxID=1448315 RepID=A0A319C5D2_9EURO|nr:ankyrin [Aspergillus uvarum CBS 121591]PYH79190.1 ankyrin [Aspergillus uvarum CBS 121591]